MHQDIPTMHICLCISKQSKQTSRNYPPNNECFKVRNKEYEPRETPPNNAHLSGLQGGLTECTSG